MHDFFEKGNAIHTRHFDIEHNHIRPGLLHFFYRKQWIRSRTHHMNTTDAIKLTGQDLPDDS